MPLSESLLTTFYLKNFLLPTPLSPNGGYSLLRKTMLSQIVRPLVNPQVRLLAKSKTTRSTLVQTIAKWLGFLGIEAKVTKLRTEGNKIQVSIAVGKPDTASDEDWQKITQSIDRDTSETEESLDDSVSIPSEQQTKYQRVLAYAIQMSNPDSSPDWQEVYPHLQELGLEESMLLGIRSALRVPQSIDRLVKDLDADVAAVALFQTANIALRDRRINSQEYQALHMLLEAMADNCH